MRTALNKHRQGSHLEPWSFSDKKECIKLYTKEDASLQDLAVHFNRSFSAVRSMLWAHGYTSKHKN